PASSRWASAVRAGPARRQSSSAACRLGAISTARAKARPSLLTTTSAPSRLPSRRVANLMSASVVSWLRMAKDPAKDAGPPESPTEKLAAVRAEIDATDDEILRLLNQRARLVAAVADVKAAMQVPFYVPSRERQIAERLSAGNPGPF